MLRNSIQEPPIYFSLLLPQKIPSICTNISTLASNSSNRLIKSTQMNLRESTLLVYQSLRPCKFLTLNSIYKDIIKFCIHYTLRIIDNSITIFLKKCYKRVPIIQPQVDSFPITHFKFEEALAITRNFKSFLQLQQQFWGCLHSKSFFISTRIKTFLLKRIKTFTKSVVEPGYMAVFTFSLSFFFSKQ